MASCWIERRRGKTGVRFRVEYRLGGRESRSRYAGSFATKREALARKAWVAGELAAMRVPALALLAEPTAGPTLSEAAMRWKESRVDVSENTRLQHRSAVNAVLPTLGSRPVDEISATDVAELVAALAAKGRKRETIRKSLLVLAMIFDHAGIGARLGAPGAVTLMVAGTGRRLTACSSWFDYSTATAEQTFPPLFEALNWAGSIDLSYFESQTPRAVFTKRKKSDSGSGPISGPTLSLPRTGHAA